MKLIVITCYFDPDYIRARTLRAGLADIDGLELIIIKNRHHGLLRYPETLLRITRAKLMEQPDAYLLTFRGQELLPFVLMLAGRRPVIFDEFIVPLAWATQEGHHTSPAKLTKVLLARLFAPLYSWQLKRCSMVLTDTSVHADLSAALSHVPRQKFSVIPVGSDETLFGPSAAPGKSGQHAVFQVLYYGNMLPLHGLTHVLAAAEQLKDKSRIEFLLVGGGKKTAEQVQAAKQNGANVKYAAWIPFERLPQAIKQADLCLGGPFGITPQAERVITGKTYQFLACAAPTLIGQNNASQLFVDGRNCLTVPLGNATALADKIAWAESHPDELLNIGQQGRRLYEQAFSRKIITSQLQQVLQQISSNDPWHAD